MLPAREPTTGRVARAAAACLALASAAACLTSSRIPIASADAISPKLTPFSHYEQGPLLFVAVDTRAAQQIDVDSNTLFPLALGIANRGRQPLTFHREELTLETSSGQRLELAPVADYNHAYDRQSLDRNLTAQFLEALNARFDAYRFSGQHLFPPRGGDGIVTDSFSLAPSEWTHLFVYFPIPESGLHGATFELLIGVEDVPETFVVRFQVR